MYDKADHGGEAVTRTCQIVVGAGPEPHVEVRADNYPTLHHALNLICHDSGMGANHAVIHLCADWEPRFAEAEQALSNLRTSSEEDYETFLCGDYDIGLSIAEESDELQRAAGLLDDFFGEA